MVMAGDEDGLGEYAIFNCVLAGGGLAGGGFWAGGFFGVETVGGELFGSGHNFKNGFRVQGFVRRSVFNFFVSREFNGVW